MSSRAKQFLPAAITVKHAHGGHPVVSRADHVVASISNHDGPYRVNLHRLEGIAQKFGLVSARAVQFRAKYAFKVSPQPEVIDDAIGVDDGFACCNEQASARL